MGLSGLTGLKLGVAASLGTPRTALGLAKWRHKAAATPNCWTLKKWLQLKRLPARLAPGGFPDKVGTRTGFIQVGLRQELVCWRVDRE